MGKSDEKFNCGSGYVCRLTVAYHQDSVLDQCLSVTEDWGTKGERATRATEKMEVGQIRAQDEKKRRAGYGCDGGGNRGNVFTQHG